MSVGVSTEKYRFGLSNPVVILNGCINFSILQISSFTSVVAVAVNAPNTPLATIEYSLEKKKVLQCYGDNDTRPCAELEDYVYKKWLPYANRKIKKIAA